MEYLLCLGKLLSTIANDFFNVSTPRNKGLFNSILLIPYISILAVVSPHTYNNAVAINFSFSLCFSLCFCFSYSLCLKNSRLPIRGFFLMSVKECTEVHFSEIYPPLYLESKYYLPKVPFKLSPLTCGRANTLLPPLCLLSNDLAIFKSSRWL